MRVDAPNVRVTPDIVFPRRRLAVFVDGCFWHCCPEHGNRPRSNANYWSLKLARNQARDEFVNYELARAGWHVLRVWEHVPTHEAASLVAAALDRRGVEFDALT